MEQQQQNQDSIPLSTDGNLHGGMRAHHSHANMSSTDPVIHYGPVATPGIAWPIVPQDQTLASSLHGYDQPEVPRTPGSNDRRARILSARTWRRNENIAPISTRPRANNYKHLASGHTAPPHIVRRQDFGPIPSDADIAFDGYLPSSLFNIQNRLSTYQRGIRKAQEDNRAASNLPVVYKEDEYDDNLYFAKWGGGWIEMNEDLVARCICPADLLQFPCRFDELPGGCQMVRLCHQLERYTNHVCPDGNFRRRTNSNSHILFEGIEPKRCGHLHWEVEPSCRFIVSTDRNCDIVTKKGFDCAVGHDLLIGRKIARGRFEAHVRDALNAGARATVKPKCIIMAHDKHLEMAEGEEEMPDPGY